MSEPDEIEAANLKLVRLHYAAYSAGDVDGIVERMDPEAELIVHDEHGIQTGPRVKGTEAVRAFFEEIGRRLTNHTVEIEDMRADGERVLANVRLGGTVRATGETGTIPAIHLFNCHGGRITSIRTHRPDWKAHVEAPEG